MGVLSVQRVANHQFLYRRGSTLYFRRGVPEAARHAFEGKREVVVSLGTSSIAEARHKLTTQLRIFDQTYARATKRPDPTISTTPEAPLSRSEIEVGVQKWVSERLDDLAAKDFGRDNQDIAAQLAGHKQYETLLLLGLRPSPSKLDRQFQTEWIADHLIQLNDWQVSPSDGVYSYLLSCIARGELEIGRRIDDEVNFNPLQQRDALFSPSTLNSVETKPLSRPAATPTVSITALYEGYIAEAACKPSTVKAWNTCLNDLIVFLQHDNAALVTAHDLVNWKTHLLAPQADGPLRAPVTVKNKYLAFVKSLFKWASENHRIETNPATGINVRVRKKTRLREAGLNDQEACAILTASLKHQDESASSLQAYARRWVPWLCAYTGARVGEITQLRSEDIVVSHDILCIRITPEAGTQKNDAARIVPLHPHLLQQGFNEAVKGRSGPLFYDPANYRGGSAGNPQSKKVAERIAKWVRSIGVDDPEVQPNHGWRHRFKTQARLVGMPPETRDAIQGHSHRTEGESYGDHPAPALMRSIRQLPTYKISPDQSVMVEPLTTDQT